MIDLKDRGILRELQRDAAQSIEELSGYDRLYKRLITIIPLTDVSSSFVMEKIKATTELPLHNVD